MRQRGTALRRAATTAAGALLLALVAAQAIRVDRTNPPVERDLGAPPEVQAVLRRACYDCHSNETVWPWYSGVAPISWLIGRDVHEGRAELNFSTWDAYAAKPRRTKLRETAEEVAEGEMPPWYYVLMHPEARLDGEARERIRAWVAHGLADLGAEARR
jgi:cytochrome c551/c552